MRNNNACVILKVRFVSIDSIKTEEFSQDRIFGSPRFIWLFRVGVRISSSVFFRRRINSHVLLNIIEFSIKYFPARFHSIFQSLTTNSDHLLCAATFCATFMLLHFHSDKFRHLQYFTWHNTHFNLRIFIVRRASCDRLRLHYRRDEF